MDYERIYSEFIADRLTKQPAKPAYSEKHHIIPRSLGGADGSENIIALTPEDHYFAHCCLAKLHGGGMWFAIKSMGLGWHRDGSPVPKFARRAMVGVARRKSAEMSRSKIRENYAAGDPWGFVRCGAENNKHNATCYEWVNLDTGAERDSTIYAMWQEFGNSRAHWTSVQTGARKSHGGWALKGSDIRIRGLKGKSLEFVNIDGRTHTGTQKSMCELTGRSVAVICRVSRGGHTTLCGWRLAGTTEINEENSTQGEPSVAARNFIY